MKCTEVFESQYRRSPEGVVFTPYRICPIGAHSDHNLGKITGFALNKGIHIAYGPKQNGVVEIASLQFPKRAQWHVNSTPDTKEGDWADHLRGATIALSKRHPLRTGMCAVVEGELPIGGLSSSAAVILGFMRALAQVNEIKLTARELIEMSQEAENSYVGVSSGKLDQSCEIYCRKGKLLYLDTMDDSFELIDTHPDMPEHAFMILFSGVERTLAGSKFNMRVDEARCAAYALMAYSGMEYGKMAQANLRQVPRSVFEEHKHKLPDNWRKRAEHWYTEFDRVVAGAEAWRRGDLKEFGRLSFASGWSSIYHWETGSPELKKLYELMTQTEGFYGGRFSGAGFKGCCMGIIDPKKADVITETVTRQYLQAFPEMEGKFSIHICTSEDGIKL